MTRKVGSPYPYSVEVERSTDSQRSGVRRASTHPDELVDNFTADNAATCWDLFQMGLRCDPEARAFGERHRSGDGQLGSFEWLSYRQVEDQALRLGSALIDLNLTPVNEFSDEHVRGAQKMRLLGLFSKNCVAWLVSEQAANAFGITTVPLYETLGQEAIRYILNETQITTVAGSASSLTTLLALAKTATTLKHIIAFDQLQPGTEALAEEYGIRVHHYHDLIEKSQRQPPSPGTRDGISTLCYTSGTTGTPKGVLLSHGNFVSAVCGVLRGPLGHSQGIQASASDSHLSYLPLAHVFERVVCNVVISLGASIGVFSGDTSKLMDDIRILKPTIFISVPRLFTRITEKVIEETKQRSYLTQCAFNLATSVKLHRMRRDGTVTHWFWDPLVFHSVRRVLGGRIRYMLVGGAPIDASAQEKVQLLMCAPLCEGYGLTETLGASFLAAPGDPVAGHAGGPVPCIEFCLDSVPEMGYDIHDTPPKGELLLRGPAVSQGYFCHAEETKNAFDDDGWFHTGDIVILLPNGAIKVIDRKKNIFKLAQGEYVAPEKIESVYQRSSFVSQVFAFGHSSNYALVGIVVPKKSEVLQWASDNGIPDASLEDLCHNQQLRDVIFADMQKVAKEGELKGFEKLKAIRLSPESFTEGNGLMTPTFKLKRHTAQERFAKEIDAMYAEIK